MNKEVKGKSTVKIVLLIIAIVIPLLVCFLICNYTYKRHLPNYLSTYYANVKYDKKGNEIKDSKMQFEAYLKYVTMYYKEVGSTSVYNGEEKVMDLYTYMVIEKDSDNVTHLDYYFLAQNINYDELTKLSFVGDEKNYKFNIEDIPVTYIYIENGENSRYIALDDFSDVIIRDYGHSPEKDSENFSLEGFNVFYGVYDALNFPSDENDVYILIYDDNGDEHKLEAYVSEKLVVERVLIDIEDFSSYEKGFDNDALAAGYVSHIFRKYWWWEAIVSLVMMGVLTYSFYIVLTYEKE